MKTVTLATLTPKKKGKKKLPVVKLVIDKKFFDMWVNSIQGQMTNLICLGATNPPKTKKKTKGGW